MTNQEKGKNMAYPTLLTWQVSMYTEGSNKDVGPISILVQIQTGYLPNTSKWYLLNHNPPKSTESPRSLRCVLKMSVILILRIT